MVVFGLVAGRGAEAYTKRFKEFQEGFFTLFLPLRVVRKRGGWLFSVSPLMPAFYQLGFIFLVLAFIFWGSGWMRWVVLVPGLLLSASGFFWTPVPYVLALRAGMKEYAPGVEYRVIGRRECRRRGWC